MSIKAVLFDLDGTLLPMDQDRFASVYMKGLVTTAVSGGYDPRPMGESILAGIAAMVKNRGERTNEEASCKNQSFQTNLRLMDSPPSTTMLCPVQKPLVTVRK